MTGFDVVVNQEGVGCVHCELDGLLVVVVVLGGLHHVTGCCGAGCGVPALGNAGNVNGVVDSVNGGSTVVEYNGSYCKSSI